MNIGVFGDSYAEKTDSLDKIWWGILQETYGHQVTVYGESASSIMFSFNLIKEHAAKYDLVIWCLTQPGRISFQFDNCYYHFNRASNFDYAPQFVAKKFKAFTTWWDNLVNWDDESVIGQALVHYLQQQVPNLMIIPCFDSPLETNFHLYQLYMNETEHYFPGIPIEKVIQKYSDHRKGHLTPTSHRILAQLINNDLSPKIFQASYDNFVTPVEVFETIFTKNK